MLNGILHAFSAFTLLVGVTHGIQPVKVSQGVQMSHA